ncbi:hypothetical protein PIB30_009676 [Stylosanthes scabra]|uniref:RNase H type-1 domain-containing protein n=1 Tax=Stylosanthes scabra TaxID=79078 RepID=A0ABU6U474_9FABA|nr:hypothetical protein [Stylosanthes scabra]
MNRVIGLVVVRVAFRRTLFFFVNSLLFGRAFTLLGNMVFDRLFVKQIAWDAYNLLNFDASLVMEHTDLVSKIKDIELWSWSFRIKLIQRMVNSAADFLAKQAASSRLVYTEWGSPLADLLLVIQQDKVISRDLHPKCPNLGGNIINWAAETERIEAEKKEAAANLQSFLSLKEAINTKPKKKRMTLSEFTGHTSGGDGGGGVALEWRGLTSDEMLRLPTGSKE